MLVLFLLLTSMLPGCANQSEADAYAEPRDGYIEGYGGVTLYYRTLGIAGDTLIVLHGGPFVDHGYLVSDLEPLAESHVLIFYDQRGTGRSTLVSDSASLHIAAHIADLEAVRRHFELQRMTLLGHSWGALLAAGYAREYSGNVRALIAVSPAPLRLKPYWDEVLPRVTAWMDSTTLEELAARDVARRDPANDAHATCRAFFELLVRGALADHSNVAMARRIAGGFCSAPAAAIRSGPIVDSLTIASLGDYDWRHHFRESGFPVLVVAGVKDTDPEEAYREWQAAFADSRLVLQSDAGHFTYVEQPERFFGVVTEFLRSQRRGYVEELIGDSG